MRIYRVDPLRDARWMELVERSPQATVFHTRAWLKSLQQTYGYKPVVFTTSAPSAELRNGLVFCHVCSWLTGSRMVCLPFSDHCEPLFDSLDELNFLLDCLQAEMQHQEWTHMEIRSVDVRFWRSNPAGFRSHVLHLLDLRSPLGETWRGTCGAQQADLATVCGRSDELLNDFYSLLTLRDERRRFPPHPCAWFRNLIHWMGDALEIRVAYKEDVPIAAAINFRFRNKTYYRYGCSDSRFQHLGGAATLLWWTIQEAKAAGSEELDMGVSDPENVGPPSLAFGDDAVPQPVRVMYWRYPATAAESFHEGSKWRIVDRAISWMPNRLLTVTGSFIHRHIGS